MRRLALVGAVALLLATVASTLAAGTDQTWNATISGKVTGKATLALPASQSSATAILYLYRMKTGTKVTAELRAATCSQTGSLIAPMPSFTTTSGGTWRDRLVSSGAGLRNLKAALAKDSPISVRGTVGSQKFCAEFALQ